jgi:hypothetical protein
MFAGARSASGCGADHPRALQGSTTFAPSPAKSLTFLVATTSPFTCATAAINASSIGA